MKTLPSEDNRLFHKKSVILLTVFALSLCWVLFLPYTLRCHDAYFHLYRLQSLVLAIRSGDLLPRIFPYLYDGFGYATSLFYSDFFLYIPALLTLAGVDILISYKIYTAILIFAVVFSTYYCARKMMNNEFSAVLTAVLYTGSSYFAVDLFVRGALGECQAFVFVPFVLLGIYNAVYGERYTGKGQIPLVVGYVGLVLSHNLTLLIMTVLFAVFLLFNIKALVKVPSRILAIAKSAGLVILLTAFFLFPMVEQLLTEKFFSTYHIAIWNPGKAAIRVRHLFWGANLSENPALTPSLGITVLLALLVCVPMFFRKPETSLHRFFTLSILGAGACLFACTSVFPWYPLDPYLNAIQFPWRLYLFITAFAAFCVGIRCCKTPERLGTAAKSWIAVVVAAVCAGQFAFTTYQSLQIIRAENRTMQDTSQMILWDEMYLHANNDRRKWANRLQYADTVTGVNGGVEATMTRDYDHRYITWFGNTTDNALEVSAVYYRGYRAVDAETGEELPVRPSRNGWLEVVINDRPDGKIVVDYHGTPIQHFSPYISLATVLVLSTAACFKKKRSL